MTFLPNVAFAEKVKDILNVQANVIAENTEDELYFYEVVGELIIAAKEETK